MNKGQLRTHIKDVLNRSDLSDALTDTFIEHTLTRIQRLLRIPSMERTATQTVAGGYDGFVVPNNFLEIIVLILTFIRSTVTLILICQCWNSQHSINFSDPPTLKFDHLHCLLSSNLCLLCKMWYVDISS